MVKNLQKSLFGAFLGLLISIQGISQNLIHNFEFNNNLNDSKPTGVSLTPFNVASSSFGTNPNSWNWTQPSSPGGGLELLTDQLPDPTSYSIGFRISFAETGAGYKKILSFKGPTDDNGLYFQNSNLEFFPFGKNAAITYTPNTFYDFVLTRNASGNILVYVVEGNGTVTEVYNTSDTNGASVPRDVNGSREFRFFMNDQVATEHTTGGSVRSIRVWDAPLSPDEIAGALGSVTTGDATAITPNSATLSGEVNPQGVASTFEFEYGTAPSTYGSTIATTPAGSSASSAVAVTADLTGLQPGTTYYYRLKATATSSGAEAFGSEKNFTTNAAGGVGGTNLWLKADAGASPANGTLTGWIDQSGNQSITINGDPQINPNIANFNSSVSFDGTADHVSVGYTPDLNTASFTLNTVVKVTGGSGFRSIASSKTTDYRGYVLYITGSNELEFWVPLNGSEWTILNGGSIALDQWTQITATYDGTNAFLYVNGEQVATGVGTQRLNTSKEFRLGAGHGTSNEVNFTFVGEIPEFLYYPSVLLSSDQLRVQSYLAEKYGITLDPSVTNYVSSDGTSVWNDATYWNDVFGIGRDDAGELNQSSSNSINTGSGDGTGQSGEGNVVISNPTSLDDGDFVMIGHDNAGLTELASGADLPGSLSGFTRIERQWLVRKTGDAGNIDLTFDTDGLGYAGTVASSYRLLIDTDQDGDFTTGQPTIVQPDPSSLNGNTTLIFNDIDLEDFYVFTIITALPSPGVGNEILWLEANNGLTKNASNVVTGWSDQSGFNSFSVVGAPAFNENAINFNPTVSFDNAEANTALPGDYLAGDTPIDFVEGFAVFRKSNANSGALVGSETARADYGVAVFSGESDNQMWVGNGITGAYQRFENPDVSTGNLALVNFDISPTASPFATARLNGASQTVTVAGGTGGDFSQITFTPWIGGTNNNGNSFGWRHFRGEVAEIVLYPSSLTAVEKQEVESYLAIKYGITLDPSIGAYAIPSGGGTSTPVWENTNYWNDVFGIGRLDSEGLNQSQSNSTNTGSGDGAGQSGAGNIVLSNPSSLDNGDFLMIGHDNTALTEQTTEVLTAGQKRITREWFVKRTGDPGTVDLSFDIDGLIVSGTTAADFKLLIDADGDFSNGAAVVDAAGLTGTKVEFTGVNLADGSYFTIITKFLPTAGPGVLGASLWLKADVGASNNGNNLTGWTDQTGTNTFTVTGTPGFLSSGLNFYPAVSFDNAEAAGVSPGDYLAGNTPIIVKEAFAVYTTTNAESGALIGSSLAFSGGYGSQILGGNAGGDVYVASGEINKSYSKRFPTLLNPSVPAVVGVDLLTGGSAVRIYIDDIAAPAQVNGSATFSEISLTPWIGGTNNGGNSSGLKHFRGQVAEIVAYNTSLSITEKEKIISYLSIKYGIKIFPSSLNYTASDGTVVFDNSGSNSYRNDVFGIGKDDASGLNLTQSNSANTGSGDGTGQSGKGNILLSNPSSLDDGDFLMIGHDRGALTEQLSDLPAGLGFYRLGREWKVQRTGDPGAVDLAFDFNGITTTGGTSDLNNYRLLIDEDGDGDFGTGTVQQITPDAFGSPKLIFNGVNLPDGVVFSIATGRADFDNDGVPDPIDEDDDNDGLTDLQEGYGVTDVGTNFTAGSGTGNVTGTLSSAAGTYVYDIVFTGTPNSANGGTGNSSDFFGGGTEVAYAVDTDGETFSMSFTPQGSATLDELQEINVEISYVNPDETLVFNQPLRDIQFKSNATGTLSADGLTVTILTGDNTVNSGFTAKLRNTFSSPLQVIATTPANRATDTHTIKVSASIFESVDTDGDGIADSFQLDSDGDGCNDVIEAGFSDPDGDGLLGPANVTVNASGRVTSGTDGYTTPRDGDANGTKDFQESGSQYTITTQPQSATVPVGVDAVMSVAASGSPIDVQWQVSTDGGSNFSDITDGGEYSGTQTASLTILTPGADKHENQYRAIVNNSAFLCNPVTSSPATLTVQDPSWTLTKSTTTPEYSVVGDILDYTLELENTGNVDISSVNIVDPNISSNIVLVSGDVGTPFVLEPGEVWIYSGTYAVTQADIDAGSYSNTASATGTPVGGTLAPATSNTVDIPAVQNPDWTLDKVARVTFYDLAGQTITYQFLVTNTGNVNITSVDVFDETLNIAPNLVQNGPAQDGILNPGEVWTYSYVYRTTQADMDRGFITNTARANGNSAAGPMVEQRDSETVNGVQNPSFSFEKKALIPSYKAVNDPITYQLILKNTGNVTLSNSNISDPLLGLNQDIAQAIPPGDSVVVSGNYKVTQADLDAGEFINTATAATEGPSGALPAATDTARVAALQSPSWMLTKTSNKSTYSQVGEVIDYTFTLTNTGNVSITGVSLSDNKVSPAPVLQSESLSPADNILSPGESFIYTATYTVTQADIDAGTIVNTATASGSVPSGAPSLADATASDTVTVQSNPSIRISKTAEKSTFELLGEVITYTLEIENTGNVTLDQLVVQDNLTSFNSGTPFSLAPAGVRTFTTIYTITQADLDAGEVVNIATVSGEDPFGAAVTGTDTLPVKAKIAAVLDLEKTASPTVFVNAGEVVTYTFELTNTGNVTLSSIVLDDPRISFNQAVQDLAPGQATTITHSYTLTQDDINAQGFVNTATATATSPLGKSVNATDQASVTAEDRGALDINKVALDQTYTQVGEVIDFEITVTNVGNVTIDNVVVTDVLTNLNVPVGTLNPGQSSSVIPTSYTILQSDLDAGQVVNIASVTGVESTPQATPVNAQDRALSVAQVRDAIIFTKVAQTADFDAVGDVLSYQLIVENAGNVTLSNVVVSDPSATVTNPNIGTLSPGQVVTLDATYTVQQADVDRGFFENIASVSGKDPLGTDVSELARATVQGLQTPSISLIKTGSPTSYSTVGEAITYTLEVTNNGNVTLSDVQVVDPLTNTNQTVSASLVPSQTVSITETYTVTQQDIDRGSIVNRATTTALDPAGQTQQTQASFTVTASQNPQLSFTKSADKTDYDSLGELITYELIVSNPGNVTLKNVIVTDPLTGLNSNIGELGPGQNRTIRTSHLVTQAELDAGKLTNTATVIASPPTGTPLSQQSSVTLNAVQKPSVDIQKNALTQSYSAVGDVLDYELIVTNTGNVSLNNVTVQDPLAAINQNLGTLAPGATQTLTGSYAVQQADLDAGSVVNVAVLEAIDPNSNTLNGQATATVSAVATPGIVLTKTANKQNFQTLGEQITYTFTVENTGNVTLSNVVVSDAKANFTSNPPSTLLPGSTGIFITTYTVTQADLDAGEIVNIASVSGEDPFATSVQSADTLKVPALQNKALELRKTASTTLFNAAGEVVTYNFQVTNIGNVTLNNVVINDPRVPFNQAVGTLAPNQAAQFSTNYTLTQADVDSLRVVNVATATGTAPDNSMVTTTDNNTITIAGVGALQLDKTAIQKTYNAAGDVLDFELKVTNTGTVTIDNIRLTDGPTGIVDLDLGSLAPGASTVIPTSYTVSQADIDAGQFQNVAFVQGVENTPQARTVSAQDAVIILATTNASVKLDKVDLTKTFDAVGTTLNYQLVVTNNGNVTLTNIQLTDPLTGLNQSVQNIAPGQSRTITTSYIIKQSDLDSGRVTNVATVDASTFGNQAVQDSDQVISQAVQKPALLVTKTADVSNFNQVGDLITYTIEVTNSGNVSLTNVIATDPLTNTNQILGNLAPGQKASISEKYQVTQADIDAGKVVNTVAVSGLDPKGSTTIGTASNTVFADQNPDLELTKTATPGTFDQVGDVITYQLVVKNTGNVTLTKSTVTDPLTGFNVNLDTLAVGASKTITEVFTISQQDIDRGFVLNTANSQALDPNSQKVSATATARVDAIQNPGIGLKKTTTTPTYSAVGDLVEFEIEVTNTGNETLSNVTVVDPLTKLDQNLGTLIPTQSQTITTSYTVTQADLDAGKILNTASVSGTDPSSQIIQANSGSQATALQNPSVSLTKTPSQSTYSQNGESITFDLLVENTGNVTLTNVVIKDPLTGLNQTITTLAPGQSTSLSTSYALTQQDLDKGQFVNTGIVEASAPSGVTVSDSQSATITATVNASVEITKSATPTTYSQVGDVIRYVLKVTNTGNVTTNTIRVVDPLTGLDRNLGILSPKKTLTLNEGYTITQQDIDRGQVVNTATVTAESPAGAPIQDDASAIVTAIQNPGISLIKTTNTPIYNQAGDVIDFTLKVTNTGNETLFKVKVIDPLTGLNQTIGTLSPGQSTSISTSYTATQADVDLGQINNSATVSGFDPSNKKVESTARSIATASQNAAISVTKTATPIDYDQVGDVITYQIVVTNSGNLTLTNVTVSDPLTNTNQTIPTLLPSQKVTITEKYTITQADIDAGQVINTVDVSGTDPNGLAVQAAASATAFAVQNPGIGLIKTTVAPGTYSQVGDVVDFELIVENTGNETLDNVTVVDPLTSLNQAIGALTPGQRISLTTSYSVTQADIDLGVITNTATASGIDPNNQTLTAGAASLANALINSEITLEKTTQATGFSQLGELIPYEIKVENTGNTTLNTISISDPILGLTQFENTIDPDQVITITRNYTVTQADLDAGFILNIAEAKGIDPFNTLENSIDSVRINAIQSPGISISKTPSQPDYSSVGEVIDYELIITNTGNVTLSNLVVTDPLTNLNQALSDLTPGETVTISTSYSILQADLDAGQVVNTATVTGTDPNQQTQAATASATATAVQNPGIALIKSVDKKEYSQAGEVLTYTLTVENTGNETLTNVTVSDPLTGLTQNLGTLTPGQSQTVTTSYTVTQADVDGGQVLNTGSVSGTDPNQTVLTADAQTVSNAVQTSGITLSKAVLPGTYDQVGDVLTYTLTVENTGNVTLENVTVVDPLTGLSQTFTTLAPGKTLTLNEQYTVTQSDLDNGQVVNTATVTGTDPSQQVQTATASATATAVQNPGIALIKSVDKKEYSQAGEVLTYTLTVENTGNETLTNVTVTDPLTNLTQNLGILTPGQNQTVTTSYTVTQADVDGGQVLNTGSVSGTDPNQTVLTADAQTVSNAVQTPGITLSKAVLPGTYDQVGDVLTYTLTVENTGNVTLENVTVVDPLTNLSQSVGTLTPGGKATLNEQYTVTQSDVDNGQVVNTATVTGTDPNQQTQAATASATATAVQNPGIALIKSVDKKEYSQAGEVLTYTLTVENTGNETLTNVTVSDPLTGLTQNLGTLTPGQSQTVTTSYTVTQADVDGGQVLNTGSVSGTDPNQTVLTADAQTVSYAIVNANAELVKTAIQTAFSKVGDVLSYELVLTNKGNVTLTNITVEDPSTGLNEIIDELSVNESITFETSYTITEADIQRGFFTNIAFAKGTYLGTDLIEANGSATSQYVPTEIIAVDDDFGVFPLSFAGTLGNVLNNDLVDGEVPNPTEVFVEIIESGNLQGVSFDLEGNLILIPGLNEPGIYQLTYRLSEVGVLENYDDAIITIELEDDRVDLSIQKVTLVDEIYEGDEFEYEVTIQNLGETAARNVVVRDELPGGVERISEEIVQVSDPQIEINPSVVGSVLTWEVPFLPSGAEIVIRINVKAGDPGLITNAASILSEGVEIDPSNNQSSVTDEIRAFRITNVITPNSDGFNDEFEIKGLHKFTENRLVIFNRLGDSVLEVDDYQNNWSAEGLNPGTYFYVLKAKNSSGEEFVFQGWIQVIKR